MGKKLLSTAQRLSSIGRQIRQWQLRVNRGGFIRGKKNIKLCQFHLDRCLKKQEQIQSEL